MEYEYFGLVNLEEIQTSLKRVHELFFLHHGPLLLVADRLGLENLCTVLSGLILQELLQLSLSFTFELEPLLFVALLDLTNYSLLSINLLNQLVL